MFAIYRVSSDYTTAMLPQVVADVIGLVTGAISSVSGLSSACAKTASKILAAGPTGWQAHDMDFGTANYGVKKSVLRSAWTDDLTKFKHLQFSAETNGSGNIINICGYDQWNAATHTAPTPMMLTGDYYFGIAPMAGGYIVLSASQGHLFAVSYSPRGDAVSTGYPHEGWFLCTEYGRDDPWNTVENGYPSWLVAGDFRNYNSASTVVTTTYHLYKGASLARVYDPQTGLDLAAHRAQTNTATTKAAHGYRTFELSADIPMIARSSADSADADYLFGGVRQVLLNRASYPMVGSDKSNTAMLFPLTVRKDGTANDGGTGATIGNFYGNWFGGELSSKCGIYAPTQPGAGKYHPTFSKLLVGGDEYMVITIRQVSLAVKVA